MEPANYLRIDIDRHNKEVTFSKQGWVFYSEKNIHLDKTNYLFANHYDSYKFSYGSVTMAKDVLEYYSSSASSV